MYNIPINYGKDEIGIDMNTFNMAEELKLFDECVINPRYVLVRLFINPSKSEHGVYLDNSNDKYNEIKGYVAKMGECCFDGYANDRWKDWYKVGDWVVFPRHAGIRVTYKNLPVFAIPDDSPLFVVPNPKEVK